MKNDKHQWLQVTDLIMSIIELIKAEKLKEAVGTMNSFFESDPKLDHVNHIREAIVEHVHDDLAEGQINIWVIDALLFYMTYWPGVYPQKELKNRFNMLDNNIKASSEENKILLDELKARGFDVDWQDLYERRMEKSGMGLKVVIGEYETGKRTEIFDCELENLKQRYEKYSKIEWLVKKEATISKKQEH